MHKRGVIRCHWQMEYHGDDNCLPSMYFGIRTHWEYVSSMPFLMFDWGNRHWSNTVAEVHWRCVKFHPLAMIDAHDLGRTSITECKYG